jgi:3-oxoacyl-[acyl-carrier-protein] synthase II
MPKDIVITGIGIICPLGRGIQKVTTDYQANINPFRISSELSNTPFAHRKLGLVTEPFPPECKKSKLHKFMSRESELAFVACHDALQDAKIDNGFYNPYRIGLYVASGMTSGNISDILPAIQNSLDENNSFSLGLFGKKGLKTINPILSFKILNNMPLCLVSIGFGIKGPNLIFNPWEGESAQAVIEGIQSVQNGSVDCAIVGATDTKINLLGLMFLQQIGLLDKNEQKQRMIPAEGACFMVLESMETAQKRNAAIYARFTGWGTSTIHEPTWKYPAKYDSLQKTISQTLNQTTANKINLIYSSFDGNEESHSAEKQAFHNIFGNNNIPIKYPKVSIGNLFAASTLLALGLAASDIKKNEHNKAILIDSFGVGSTVGAFLLESIC